jgi:HprK-related kinase B
MSSQTSSIEQPFQQIRDHIAASSFFTSRFRFADRVVEVCFNHLELKEKIDRYYQHFKAPDHIGSIQHFVIALHDVDIPLNLKLETKPPEPGKQNTKEEYVEEGERRIVRKIKTQVKFFYERDRFTASGPLLENDNQLVNFINNIFMGSMLKDREAQLFHAAALCHNNKGMGMAGPSGMGKSTLCLNILGEGYHLVSNDRLMVHHDEQGLGMCGVPKYPRINPGTILNHPKLVDMWTPEQREHYRSIPNKELWDLEEKYDGMIEEHYPGSHFQLESSMEYFVIINWERHSPSPFQLKEISLRQHRHLLPHIMKGPGVVVPGFRYDQDPLQEEPYLELMDRCTVFELSGGLDFSGASRALRGILGAPAP